ncbi:MAG: 3-hydroxybutyrate dehydrogenase [Acidobacteriota bacterium]|nr:3-hydroxybutyrate dehydrogenase [Acidobacteriota bacterium]
MTGSDQDTLKDKVAVVTGAASGIGLAIAQGLAESGVKVCLVDIQKEALDHVVSEIYEKGGNAIAAMADLGSESEIKSLHDQITHHLGTVDILVNNAGLQYVSPLESFPIDEWDRLIGVMLRGAFLGTQQFLPAMVKAGWGRIINIASIHSIVASPFKSAYVSAKHGLLGLTKTAALEVATKGITVNAISPAYVRTPLVERQIESQAKLHSIPRERVLEEIMLTPMPQKELIEPKEIGDSVIFLCSAAARHINGHNLVMDGGWTVT